MIFSKNTIKDAARLSLAKWYDKVEKAGFKSFNVIAATLYEHYNEVLNFFINRSTNAFAESFNAKLKAFRVAFRGVSDINFFLFRLSQKNDVGKSVKVIYYSDLRFFPPIFHHPPGVYITLDNQRHLLHHSVARIQSECFLLAYAQMFEYTVKVHNNIIALMV